MADKSEFNPKRPPQGYQVYVWNALSKPVICWIEAEAGSAGGEYEPPSDPYVELVSAWLGDVDLAPILSDEQYEEICDEFIAQEEQERTEYQISKWESDNDYC